MLKYIDDLSFVSTHSVEVNLLKLKPSPFLRTAHVLSNGLVHLVMVYLKEIW